MEAHPGRAFVPTGDNECLYSTFQLSWEALARAPTPVLTAENRRCRLACEVLTSSATAREQTLPGCAGFRREKRKESSLSQHLFVAIDILGELRITEMSLRERLLPSTLETQVIRIIH